MGLVNTAGKPRNFVKRVHRALRSWHAQDARDVLDDLLLAHCGRSEQEGVTPRLATNQLLLNGIDRLQQTDHNTADLLRRRFLDQEKVYKVAYHWNISEDMVFQWQRKAIIQLSDVIWEQENELRQE